MEDTPKVYKPLVETEDGRLVSIIAGKGIPGTALEYKEGGITYSPSGEAGIWVNENFEECKWQGLNNKSVVGVLVVHEAIPLGEKSGDIIGESGNRNSFSDDLRYPAILLGKEVWREEPVRPEPEFKLGDKVELLDVSTGAPHLHVGMILTISSVGYHGDNYVYRVLENDYSYIESWFKPAPPEPVWVEITGKCTPRFFGRQLYLGYENYWVLYQDIEGVVHTSPKFTGNEYKVEVSVTPSVLGVDCSTYAYRVFKKDSVS